MGTAYFLSNYFLLTVAFISIVYVWPRIIFSNFLSNKSVYYKIFFCFCAVLVIWSIVIPFMAMLHLISVVSLIIVFFVPLIITVIIKFILKYKKHNGWIFIKNGLCGWFDVKKSVITNIDFKSFNFWYKTITSFVVVLCVFFLWRFFIDYSLNNVQYGFSDMPRHEAFMNNLFRNSIYGEGFYPLGMHSILVFIEGIFKIRSSFIILYAGSFSVILLFIAFYFWLKNTFNTRVTICIVFLLFLFLVNVIVLKDNTGRMIYDGLHRLNWTLPQEFALWAVFVSPVYLLKILKNKDNIKSELNVENLVIFALCFSATLFVHWYTTIFQCVMCLATFLAYVTWVNKEKFVALLLSVLAGSFAGLIPMFIGLLYSGKMSWSVTWAQKLPSGETITFESISSVVQSNANSSLAKSSKDIFSQLFVWFKTLFEDAMWPLMPRLWFFVSLLLFLASIAIMIVLLIKSKDKFQQYLPVFIALILFFAMYAAPVINLVRILESYRIIICLYLLITSFNCIWIDFVFTYARRKIRILDESKKFNRS